MGCLLPAEGGTVAAMIGYNEAKRFAKDKSQFGKGDIRGVIAPEAAFELCHAWHVPFSGFTGGAAAAMMGFNPYSRARYWKLRLTR